MKLENYQLTKAETTVNSINTNNKNMHKNPAVDRLSMPGFPTLSLSLNHPGAEHRHSATVNPTQSRQQGGTPTQTAT